ncbi:MAG: DEAD/DEAH box helicase [Deferribacteres bacterium]|nr:DEAD/DEAH box helicase [Deferribacteres bacterium]
MSFTFESLSESVKKALADMGYTAPTPIQEAVIPAVLSGFDVVGQAETGTGKTAAFGIPIVEAVSRRSRGVKALILVPTRELAIQVADEISKIGAKKRISVFPFYGGTSVNRQISLLKRDRVKVLVGTPGRIRDLIEREALSLSSLRFFVLDEMDQMLDMGFIEDIDFILSKRPENTQTMFFSATVPYEVRELARRYLKEDHKFVSVKSEVMAPRIEEKLYFVPYRRKLELLKEVLKENLNGGASIIFVKTKKDAFNLGERLKKLGFSADAIHGDLSQRKRESVMRRFREGKVKMLVATDVASRGIDVKAVELVVNYELPEDPELYLHRIGRTARAGGEGLAVSFVSPLEINRLKRIKSLNKVKAIRVT